MHNFILLTNNISNYFVKITSVINSNNFTILIIIMIIIILFLIGAIMFAPKK